MNISTLHRIVTGGDGVSYKIQYSPDTNDRYPQNMKRRYAGTGKYVAIFAVMLAALLIHFHGVPDFLIPGDPQVTKAAASVLVDDIRDGVAVKDAITTFCSMVLDGAEISY